MLEIQKCLVISNMHIELDDIDWLNHDRPGIYTEKPGFFVPTEYGWIINYLPSEDWIDRLYPDTPNNIRNIVTFALTQGCHMVKLDRDGDEIDQLPKFDW